MGKGTRVEEIRRLLGELRFVLTSPVTTPAVLAYTTDWSYGWELARQVPGPVGLPIPAGYDVYGADRGSKVAGYTKPARPVPVGVAAFRSEEAMFSSRTSVRGF